MFEKAPAAPADLTQKAINTIKFLAIDAIEKSKSGHPGLPMGAADYAFILWSRYLKHDPSDPKWPDRDRFVLSAGHGSMLLYSLLHLAGYDLSIEDIKQFRQWGSKTPGHPESHLTPGVEVTTGPLGQGFGNGVGMALAAKMAEARFPGLFNHRVWGIVSDGDMMEGVSHEAASLAGHLKLGNLTYIYDDNKITLDGSLDESMSEDVGKRFEAYGWRILHIDGHDHTQIENAFDAAVNETERPFLILARTHIGNGAPHKHDTHKVHGEPLGPEETKATKEANGWPLDKPFWVPDDVRALWNARKKQLAETHAAWNQHQKQWLGAHADQAALYRTLTERRIPQDLLQQLASAAPAKTDATRALSGTILQKAAALVPSLVGGDADLGGSTKTPIKDSPKVKAGDFIGRNLRFGIREHAMGAIANGMSGYGMFIPFTATFLTFSDYMRPAIRLAALSQLQVVHVFTHDSVFLGEDGPTHQAVEHVSALRLIPNVHVWRPADAVESAAAWAAALARTDGPSELILSRQKVADPPPGTRADDALRGGYVILKEEGGAPEVIFLATGSEVGIAVEAAHELAAQGKRVRVVSIPCLEVFAAEDEAWRNQVLPAAGLRVSVEAGRTNLWRSWVGPEGITIGVDTFGHSAPYEAIAEHLGLTGKAVAERVRQRLSR
ncbi:MAG: Transketolase [Acidobacteria bacterium]|nr:Transketolase [Acidobacteriota bacterium]